MRLFKEPDAAGDGERDVPFGQLKLQLQRVEMRAVKHGHLVQIRAFIPQFQYTLGDERGLLRGVHAGDQRRFQAGLARRREFFVELVPVGANGGIGHLQYFRRAAVIRFNFEHLGAGITFGEFQNVGEIRAAPGVDALRVVADHRDVVMPFGQQVHEVALKFVGVLVFVHEDELESALVQFAHLGMLLKQLEPERKQIVKVHRVRGALALDIARREVGNLRAEL